MLIAGFLAFYDQYFITLDSYKLNNIRLHICSQGLFGWLFMRDEDIVTKVPSNGMEVIEAIKRNTKISAKIHPKIGLPLLLLRFHVFRAFESC